MKSLKIPCGFTSTVLYEHDVRQAQEAVIRHLPDCKLKDMADAVMSYFILNCLKDDKLEYIKIPYSKVYSWDWLNDKQ